MIGEDTDDWIPGGGGVGKGGGQVCMVVWKWVAIAADQDPESVGFRNLG